MSRRQARGLVLFSALSLLGAVIPAATASAAPRPPLATLQNPAVSAPGFGKSVAVSGSTMVVGSDSATGAVFIYTKGTSGWPTTPTVTLQDPDATGGDYFGWAVAVSGTTIVVGAFQAHGGSGVGAVYLYTKGTSGWPTTPTVTLQDPDATPGDRFGGAVAVSGATILVEAIGAAMAGDVYIYTKGTSGWPTTPAVTLPDPDATPGDSFGGAVAVSGATIVLNAVVNSRRGIVYVYTKGPAGWPTTPTVTLRDPGKLTSDAFASAVGVSGTTIVVGAFGADAKRGAAYVYVGGASAWPTTPTVTLQNPDAVPPSKGPGDFFGYQNIAVSGTTLTIGAYDTRKSRGAAYIYKQGSTGWPNVPTVSIHDPTAVQTDGFGTSVAVSGPSVVIGSPNAKNTVGVTYVYAA